MYPRNDITSLLFILVWIKWVPARSPKCNHDCCSHNGQSHEESIYYPVGPFLFWIGIARFLRRWTGISMIRSQGFFNIHIHLESKECNCLMIVKNPDSWDDSAEMLWYFKWCLVLEALFNHLIGLGFKVRLVGENKGRWSKKVMEGMWKGSTDAGRSGCKQMAKGWGTCLRLADDDNLRFIYSELSLKILDWAV